MGLKQFTRVWRSPAFAGLVVATIALGVGPLAVIVGVVDRLLVRPLPYPDAHRLVVVNEATRDAPDTPLPVSFPNLTDWDRSSRSFENLAGVFANPNFDVNLTGGSEPERVPVARVTWDYFDVLGVEPALGRTFLAEEDRVGRHRVAILSHGLWERRFAGDPDILERTVDVNGFAYEVVGVLPDSYRPVASAAFGEGVDLWRPVAASEDQRVTRDWRFLQVVGRLAEDADLADARREMSAIADRLAREHPAEMSDHTVRLEPLRSRVVGDVRSTVLVLLGGVGVLLLIACVNVAGLVLVRSLRRRRDLALRAAIGASPGTLLRHTLVEVSGAVVPGIALGLAVAWLSVPILAGLAPREIPYVETLGVDGRVALIAAGVTTTVAFLAALVPAAGVLGFDLRTALTEGGTRLRERAGVGLQAVLVSGQIALAAILLVSAGLVGRSLMALTAVDPGFDAERVLSFQLELPMVTRYPDQAERDAFFDELLGRLEARPEIVAAGRASVPPMGEEAWGVSFGLPGQPESGDGLDFDASLMLAGPGYFTALGIDVLQGRAFDSRDRRDATPVVVVNRTLADRFWPDGMPPGERLTLSFGRTDSYEIVGVVEDVRLSGLDEPATPTIYWPTSQHTHNFLTLFARTTGEPESLVPVVRRIVREMDPLQPIYNLRPMERLIAGSAGRRRFAASILGTMAALAVVLAGVGLFGTVSHSVRNQTREIGIRLALGSGRPAEVRRLVGWSMRLVVGGLAVGLVAAWFTTTTLSGLLYGVKRWDPTTFAAITGFILLVSLFATLVPALRAARIDPLESIRVE